MQTTSAYLQRLFCAEMEIIRGGDPLATSCNYVVSYSSLTCFTVHSDHV